MVTKEKHELLEDADSPTGVVKIAQKNGAQLEHECEEQTKSVRRKMQALRDRLARTRYSNVRK